jgi:hypothetical protein
MYSQVMITLKGAGKGVMHLVREAVIRAAKIDHATVWCEAKVQQDGEKSNCLIFISTNEETTKQAISLLNSAGLLCTTDLGHINPISIPYGVPCNEPYNLCKHLDA